MSWRRSRRRCPRPFRPELRVGLVSDAHVAPAGTPPERWHNDYRFEDAAERLDRALAVCVEHGAETIALLGDLAHLGDDASLDAALEVAAGCGRPLWLVGGNHDATVRPDALAGAAGRAGITLATAEGVAVEGIRVAGLADESATPATAEWGPDPVLWLTHYPVVSREARAHEAGLKYAGDLPELGRVAEPLLARSAPTIVVSGHLHIRETCHRGALIQLACAALIEPPFEATVLELEAGEPLQVRAVHLATAATPPGTRVPVLAPERQHWVFERGRWSEILAR